MKLELVCLDTTEVILACWKCDDSVVVLNPKLVKLIDCGSGEVGATPIRSNDEGKFDDNFDLFEASCASVEVK